MVRVVYVRKGTVGGVSQQSTARLAMIHFVKSVWSSKNVMGVALEHFVAIAVIPATFATTRHAIGVVQPTILYGSAKMMNARKRIVQTVQMGIQKRSNSASSATECTVVIAVMKSAKHLLTKVKSCGAMNALMICGEVK